MWRAKNADTFKPMGPWIVTDLDYRTMTTAIRLNGTEVDRFKTSNMIHDVEQYNRRDQPLLHPVSRRRRVDGHGRISAQHEARGRLRSEITGIGVLRNRIIAEE
jgi:2-keto-4-pentenoate hydratase/2-oxohepta-3-ene-1,7-dioic acid hydratase in catechol pathway